METNGQYKYLRPRRGSRYRQLFVEGRIKAEILYRATIGSQAQSAAEVAHDYGLPVDAVLEAIRYAEQNASILAEDRAMEDASIQAHGLDRWPYAPQESLVER